MHHAMAGICVMKHTYPCAAAHMGELTGCSACMTRWHWTTVGVIDGGAR